MMNPSFLRVAMLWGLRPWHRLTLFEARPQSDADRGWYQRVGVFRRSTLSPLLEPAQWLEHLESWKPHLLQGYSLTLKLLADAARKQSRAQLRIPLIVSTSGVLDSHGRRLLETTFGSRVADVYASEEAGSVIAWECPNCARYHLSEDTVVVEFLKPEDRSLMDFREVIITNLTNLSMPFIRYRQGDLGSPSTSVRGCIPGFRTMDKILGRQGDYIRLPSGKVLTPHPFFRILDEEVGVGIWSIVQTQVDEIEVRISSTGGAELNNVGQIFTRIRDLVGPDVRISIVDVAQLRADGFEKLRSVISHVPIPEDKTPSRFRDPL